MVKSIFKPPEHFLPLINCENLFKDVDAYIILKQVISGHQSN